MENKWFIRFILVLFILLCSKGYAWNVDDYQPGGPWIVNENSQKVSRYNIDGTTKITVYGESGNALAVNSDGSITPRDFYLEVSKGNVAGHRPHAVLAQNPLVGTATEDIWDAGGTMVYPTGGERWEIFSSSGEDTLAGTGVQTLTLKCLDDEYIRYDEIIEMEGATPVLTDAIDLFRFGVVESLTVGSAGSNVGNITIRVTSGGATRGMMLAGNNKSKSSHYTVPAGITAYLYCIVSNINKGEDIQIELLRTIGDNGIFREETSLALYQTTFNQPFALRPRWEEKSDIKLTAISSNTNAIASTEMAIMEVEN